MSFQLDPASSNFTESCVKIVLILSFSAVLGATVAVAQAPEQGSQDFFGKDFASSPLSGIAVNEEPPEPRPTRRPFGGREELRREPARFNHARSPIAAAPRPIPERPPGMSANDYRNELRRSQTPAAKSDGAISKISLVVNSLDRKHFDSTIRELIAVSQKTKIPVGEVIHIGDYSVASEAVIKEISSRGGNIFGATEPPPEYGIQSSPTWILVTPNGKILLEGVRAVGLYIGPEGEFTERPLVPDRPPEVDVRGEF